MWGLVVNQGEGNGANPGGTDKETEDGAKADGVASEETW